MASLPELTVKLQGRSTDILEAHSIVSEVQSKLSLCRENTDEEFQDITDETDKIGIQIKVPKQIGKQKNRCIVSCSKCGRNL